MPAQPFRFAASSLTAYLIAAAVSAGITLLASPLRHVLDPANLAMLFLLTVFLVALKLGRGPAVLTACANVVLLDFVIVPPHFEFIPTDVQYLVTLVVMLIVGLVTTQLTGGLRQQAALNAERERETRLLYELARDLAGSASVERVGVALADYAARLGCQLDFDSSGAPASSATGLDFPLNAIAAPQARLRVTLPDRRATLDPAEETRFRAVASLLATALDRLHYVQLAQQSQMDISAERLRSSMLAALSHDLRTPMTVLIGLADSLLLSKETLPAQARDTALLLLRHARALGGLLNNVLDMARLHSGRVSPRKEWHLLDDVISASLRLLKPQLADHALKVRLDPEVPLVELDPVLLERVVCNLIDNAAKYSPAGTPIEISTHVDDSRGKACIEVCDHGEGFPEDKIARLFELFERGNPESSVPGMGLGLSICLRIVEAHGGDIVVRNREGGGACVSVGLPLGSPPAVLEE